MKKMEADVVVIGGGMSGLIAATAAAEKDAGVIVLEKSGTVGGAASMGMGFFAVESKYQNLMLYDYTVDQAFNDFMTYNHWRSDAKLVRRIYKQSADTIDWIERMGVEFLGAFSYFKGSRSTWHVVKTPGSNKLSERCASIMIKAIKDYADELGVRFFFQTTAKEIVIGDKGQITGVHAQDSSGEEIDVECSCAIVATGGFGDNPDMFLEHMGLKWGKDIFSMRIPGLLGEGMKMAWAAGAGKTPVNVEVNYSTPGVTALYNAISEVMRQPNLMVNLDGNRFINEAIMNNTTFTGNSLLLQRGNCGFSIVGEDTVDSYRETGLDYMTHHFAVRDTANWEAEIETYQKGSKHDEVGIASLISETGGANFWVCGSIEEISEKTGIELAPLKKTIEKYNSMAGGYDEEFAKPARYMKPVTGDKFYVARHFPGGYGSLGGIKVNSDMNCLTQDGVIVPGLFSCGTDACTIFGDSYNFFMPGSTMGFAINSGRIAGIESVNYIDGPDFVE